MAREAAGSRERYFLEIPIYWCAELDFNARYNADLKAHLYESEVRSGYPLSNDFRIQVTVEFWKNYVAPWHYNQAVGWLRLYVLGSSVRADEWFTSARRFGRVMRKKHISLIGKAFEVHCWPEMSSEDIFREVLAKVRKVQSQSTRKVVLDLDCFISLGSFVDWRRLVDNDAAWEP